MEPQYITSINAADKAKILLLIETSLQAYRAFNKDDPVPFGTDHGFLLVHPHYQVAKGSYGNS